MGIRWEGGPPASNDRRYGPPRRPRRVPRGSSAYAPGAPSVPNSYYSPQANAGAIASGLTRTLNRSLGGGARTAHSRKGSAGASNRGAVLNRVLSGLDPNEKAMAVPAIKAMRKTGVPASLLVALSGQESAFGTNTGPSSAGAQGVTQFIPSTRQSMIDKYGVDPWKSPEQGMLAAALYLKELGVNEDPSAALSSYSGGYAEGDYNNPILSNAQNYRGLDKLSKGKLPRMPKPLSTSEMYYDPGINLSENQPTSGVGGHGTHLHFASTRPRDVLRVAKLAQKFGNTVSENPAFGGVAPVHATNSFHDRNMNISNKLMNSRLYKQVGASGDVLGQALDISGGNLGALNRRIASLSGAPAAPGTVASVGSGGVSSLPGYAGGGAAAPPPRAMPNRQSAGGGGASSAIAARASLPTGDLFAAPQMTPDDLLEQLAAAGNLRPKRRRQSRSRLPQDPYLTP